MIQGLEQKWPSFHIHRTPSETFSSHVKGKLKKKRGGGGGIQTLNFGGVLFPNKGKREVWFQVIWM